MDEPVADTPGKKKKLVKKTVIVRKVRKADGSVITTTTPAKPLKERAAAASTASPQNQTVSPQKSKAPVSSPAATSVPSKSSSSGSALKSAASKPAPSSTSSKPVGSPVATAAGAYRSSSPIRTAKTYALTVGFETRVAQHESSLAGIQQRLNDLELMEEELKHEKRLLEQRQEDRANGEAQEKEKERIRLKEADLEEKKKQLLNAVADEELKKSDLLKEQAAAAAAKLSSINHSLHAAAQAGGASPQELSSKREADIQAEIQRMKDKHKLYDGDRQQLLHSLAHKHPLVRLQKLSEWIEDMKIKKITRQDLIEKVAAEQFKIESRHASRNASRTNSAKKKQLAEAASGGNKRVVVVKKLVRKVKNTQNNAEQVHDNNSADTSDASHVDEVGEIDSSSTSDSAVDSSAHSCGPVAVDSPPAPPAALSADHTPPVHTQQQTEQDAPQQHKLVVKQAVSDAASAHMAAADNVPAESLPSIDSSVVEKEVSVSPSRSAAAPAQLSAALSPLDAPESAADSVTVESELDDALSASWKSARQAVLAKEVEEQNKRKAAIIQQHRQKYEEAVKQAEIAELPSSNRDSKLSPSSTPAHSPSANPASTASSSLASTAPPPSSSAPVSSPLTSTSPAANAATAATTATASADQVVSTSDIEIELKVEPSPVKASSSKPMTDAKEEKKAETTKASATSPAPSSASSLEKQMSLEFANDLDVLSVGVDVFKVPRSRFSSVRATRLSLMRTGSVQDTAKQGVAALQQAIRDGAFALTWVRKNPRSKAPCFTLTPLSHPLVYHRDCQHGLFAQRLSKVERACGSNLVATMAVTINNGLRDLDLVFKHQKQLEAFHRIMQFAVTQNAK